MGNEGSRIQIALEEASAVGVLKGGPLDISVDAIARDDCAVLHLGSELDLVIGSDFVRGTGFYLFQEGLLSYEDIGWYLVAANISDIAAMGARPAGVVVALRYHEDMSDDEWRTMMRGICGACRQFEVPLLGGDSGGYAENVMSAAAIGIVPRNRALLRSAGSPGDRLFLSGTVGAAGAAVAYFYRGRHRGVRVSSVSEQRLLDSWRRVQPAVAQGAWLSERGCCRCAIDTSDGLKASLIEIATRSGVDIVLIPGRVPVDRAAIEVAEAMGINVMELAMSDSVDFRLLFSVAKEYVDQVQADFSRQNWELYEIGHLREATGLPRVVQTSKSGEIELPGIPWDHSNIATVDRLLGSKDIDGTIDN